MKKLRYLALALAAAALLTAATCSGSVTCRRTPDGTVECTVEGHHHPKE